MKTSSLFPKSFITKEMVHTPLVYTIRAATVEKGFGGQKKPVLLFIETTLKLPLNKTRVKILEAYYGDDTDLWQGKRVQLYLDPTVEFGGEIIGGVGIRCSGKPLMARSQLDPADGSPPAGARFDPQTGLPIEQGRPAARFDPFTGKPLTDASPPGVDPATGETGPPQTWAQQAQARAEEFDDDIPF